MSDSLVIVAPPGTLNSNAAMAYSSSHPQNQVSVGSLLVTVNSVQKTLATWLGTIPAITLPLSAANGGTGATALGTSSFSLDGSTLVARNKGKLQAQWVMGAVLTADTFYFAYSAPYGGTINSMTYLVGTGSFTVAVNIAGTPVTSLSAVTVNSATPATTNATGANTFTAGQIISGVVSSPSGSPTDALLILDVTWAD
jgi:hypothetical protein